jgi:hypothetical protein
MEQFARGMPTQLPTGYGDYIQQMMNAMQTGLPTPVPEQWGAMQPYAQEMMQTGRPVDVGGWWKAQQPLAERYIKEQSEQAMEQAGLMGLRYSTPAQRMIGDITGRTTEALWGDLAGRELGAQEQARQRQLAGQQQMYGLGAGVAGLGEQARARQMGAFPYMYQGMQLPTQLAEANKARALQAAGGLMGVGGQYAQLPLQVSAQAMNMGQAMQQQRQQAFQPLYQEFLRRLPEMSPWLTLGMQGTAMPFQSVPQMYQPSFLSQLMNVGTQVPYMGGQQGFGWWG